MIKNTAPKFIREFTSETTANHFAQANSGKVIIRYDYDNFTHSIIKRYIVKY